MVTFFLCRRHDPCIFLKPFSEILRTRANLSFLEFNQWNDLLRGLPLGFVFRDLYRDCLDGIYQLYRWQPDIRQYLLLQDQAVYRASSPEGTYSTIAENVAALPYTDTGLDSEITYYYKIIALNSSGQSGLSAEASATTQAASP
ncbi:hypothetical protein A7D23_11235 [Dehalobacter sp. TeCB1]|uniref:Fibronectin type-III domain-containing protein n=1 Tax=Dehalobacter restrictus (strain DSM 9455 / PER-K23) TaxID=871738 RepID=A0ABN4C0V5_DEHRP|nr:hypothetical protein DEHRE_12900 [Dehalobacter restrictus DSM 9455]OCZ52181.1 hypothetical protein A7D23_11235 [Dehalobacter sp. TeCB1]